MKIAGIIAEYNPFHNGHMHHLAETRRRAGCDYIVVCMDGSYTQRGEAACIDKWTRARAALQCGADAVFELPTLWAVNTADVFARGGVAILGALGCDLISFGCETADLDLLNTLADLRENEPETLRVDIKNRLKEGKSHARARGEALSAHLNLPVETLNAPNLTLGVEYIRALRILHCDVQPFPISRVGGYHDDTLSEIASASAIRNALRRSDDVKHALPECLHDALKDAKEMHAPDDLLLHTLRSMSEARIAALPGVNEGLEKRVHRAAMQASSQSELMDALKCKRYTHARIARLCAHALLGMEQTLLDAHPLPDYARLIGMREDARPLLRELKARSSLPICSDAAQLARNAVFQLECRATDLRALQCADPEDRRAGQEFTHKFVRI